MSVMIDTLLMETEQFLVSRPNKPLHPSGVNNLVSEVHMGKKPNKHLHVLSPNGVLLCGTFESNSVQCFL